MRKITFDEEELFVIAVFEPFSRKGAIADMDQVLPELSDDDDIRTLVVSAREKLKRITDREFKELDIEDYLEDLEWEDDEGRTGDSEKDGEEK